MGGKNSHFIFNEEQFRALADAIPHPTWITGPKGRIIWYNELWLKYTGMSVDEMAGDGWKTMIHPRALTEVAAQWERSLISGEPFEMSFPLRGHDGKFRQFLTRAKAIRDAQGEISHWVGTNTDIQNEVDIAADLELKSAAIENSLNGFDIVDENGRFIYVNKSYLKMWGYDSEEEVLGTSPAGHCADPEVPGKIIHLLKTTGQCDIEFVARRKDGSTFDVRMLAFLAHDTAGREIYPTTSIDITEQKRATEAIKSSEAYFKHLVDTSPAMIWITDQQSRCTYLSQRWYDYTGRTPEQDLGTGWVDNVHPEDRARAAEVYTNAVSARGPLRVDYRLRRADGIYRWMVDLGSPRLGKNGEFLGYIGTVTDIHDRVLIENKLKNETDRFQRSARASGLGVWYCDLPFDVLEWSDEVKAHFFLPPETRVTIETFYERIHPDDRERTRMAIANSIRESTHYDTHYRTTDATDPSKFKWIRAVGWTDYDVNGEPIRFDGITLDETEQILRNEELIRARDEAERANHLKSAFLANMSHEIRTPLGAMIGFSDLLRDPGISPSERNNYLDILVRNGEQLGVIINDILDLSKVEAGHLQMEFVETHPEQIVAEVISSMRLKAKAKDLALEFVCDQDTPEKLISDPYRIKQVLLNLVGNAIKFTAHGGVRIRSSAGNSPGAKTLRFEIEDTGIGISPEHVANIFQMFVQADGSMTRRFGGTGLGLALSRRLARQMGGEVELKASEPGRGSVFIFTVKDMPERMTSPVKSFSETRFTEPPQDALANARILIVDDSPDNQSLIWLHLRKYGAQLDSAENGLTGVKKALHGNFDLVLMDLQMPLMDGYSATQRLRENGFRKPIIALTAHAMSDVRDKCLQVGCNDHLPKPINAYQLVTTIMRNLNRTLS